VVLAYTTSSHLMLDYDLKTETEAVGFTRKYAKFHKLGSALTILTSEVKQMDLNLDKDNLLNRYSAIFGKPIHWSEIQWHVKEAYELGMVEKGFLALRQFGSITIRTSAKNPEIPAPKIVDYFPNGDRRGVMGFLRHWVMCRNLGEVNDGRKRKRKA
jgi:hypothetical protein